MATTTVRIDPETHRALRDLAASTGQSMQQVLAKSVELYRERRFWDEVNATYATLRADAAAWQDEQGERAAWEATLGDGLDDFPYEGVSPAEHPSTK